MTSSDDLEAQIEALAELEHLQWMEWASNLSKNEELSDERLRRWNRLYVPYSELDEEAKEQDRIWARKVLAITDKAHLDRDRKMKAELASKLTAIERGNPGMKYFALLRSEIAKLEADSKTEASE